MHIPIQYDHSQPSVLDGGQAQQVTLAKSQYRVLYTRGDELLTPGQYRSTFDTYLGRGAWGGSGLDDMTAARLFSASSTAYACTEYSATTTAGFPLIVTDPKGDQLAGSPLDHVLAHASTLLHSTVISLLLWGRCYLRKRRNRHGFPSSLEWLNPLDVREIEQGGFVVEYDVATGAFGTVRERVTLDDMVYMQMFDPDPDGKGLSKFEIALQPMSSERGRAVYAAAFFVNSARPDGMLTFDQPLSDEEFDQAQNNWRQFKGAGNAHRTAVMPGGARWTPIQTAPIDLALGEQGQQDKQAITAIFQVPPALVGLGDVADPLSANSTYSAMEISYIRNVALPRMKTIILPALNEQWAHKDFNPRDHFTLAVDENRIPALADANLARSDTAIHLVGANIADYPESREMLGLPKREDFFLRDPADPLSMWQAGAITLNEARRFIGVKGEGGAYTNPNCEVVLIGGQLFPAARLREIADANAQRLITPPPPASPFGLNAPEANALPAPTDIDEPRTEPSLCVALLLGDDPDLVQLQARVRTLYAADGLTWNEPSDFHVTLLYAPHVTDDEVSGLVESLRGLNVRDLTLKIGSLNSFDALGEHALHFRIKRNAALLDLQATLYDTFEDAGVGMSAYSRPAAYTPHITMGYSAHKIKRVVFQSQLAVTPRGLIVWRGDDVLLDTSQATDVTAPMAVPSAVEVVTRATSPLELVISFADHQFVRQARRALSTYLTAQEAVVTEWVGDDAWRYVLVSVPNWTPSKASALMKSLDLDAVRKLDLASTGFTQEGDGIYLQVDAEKVASLQKALLLDVADAGLKPGDVTVGIRLCAVEGTVDLSTIEPVSYPLVASNVAMVWADVEQHRWALRGLTQLQQELGAWEKCVRRKGRDYDFTTNALTDTPTAAFVTDALDAGLDTDATFALAADILRGVVVLRAYPETREAFIAEMKATIGAAAANETDRRNFAARMRVTLRRLGLQAFRDGMNAEGYDPESFSAKELAAFRTWQDEASRFVSDFGAEIFKEAGLPDTSVDLRAEMWADKSLREIYFIGSVLAAPQKKKRWKRNPAKDSCEDCITRDGQVKTLEEWDALGLPGSNTLACHGYHCGCGLEDAE